MPPRSVIQHPEKNPNPIPIPSFGRPRKTLMPTHLRLHSSDQAFFVCLFYPCLDQVHTMLPMPKHLFHLNPLWQGNIQRTNCLPNHLDFQELTKIHVSAPPQGLDPVVTQPANNLNRVSIKAKSQAHAIPEDCLHVTKRLG